MRHLLISLAATLLLVFVSAQEYQFARWNSPRANLAADDVYRRQAPPPGYHPEFGTCGSGTTCENACGTNWITCQASTNLSLFCYNKVDLNQTCCANGSGRACDNGYYCAWQEFGGKVWCCENGQSLEECGVPQTASSTTSGTATSTTTGSVSSTSGPGPSSSPSGSTSTSTISSGGPGPSESSSTSTSTPGGNSSGTSSTSTSGCPAATVTSWATTTVVSSFSFAAVTVTVTEQGWGCSSSLTSSSHSGPPVSYSTTGTITEPPSPSSTSHRPSFHNSTSTIPLVTAGAAGLEVNRHNIVLVMAQLLWLLV